MKVRKGDDEWLIRDVRELIVTTLELAPQRLGEPHGRGSEKALLVRLRRIAPRSVDVIVWHMRVCGHRFNPSFAVETILDPEVRRWMRLCDEQPLFPKRRQQLRLP